jgi:dienelactone hydrolase
MIDPKSDWREQISTDPMKSLDGSRVPTLIIFGQEDVWIPVADALHKLESTKALHPNITTRVVSGATHEMMLGVDRKREIDPASFSKFAPNAPAYFGVLGAWLAERGIARAEFR